PSDSTWRGRCGRRSPLTARLSELRPRLSTAMHPSRDDYLLLLFLGLVWGFSFLLVKLAVGTLPPITVAAGRLLLRALAFGLFPAAARRPLASGRAFRGKARRLGVRRHRPAVFADQRGPGPYR